MTAVAAKAIITAYYGLAPHRSYVFGCPDGGREGLTEAQRCPHHVNGVLAGATADIRDIARWVTGRKETG
jgi:feruloyl esterase